MSTIRVVTLNVRVCLDSSAAEIGDLLQRLGADLVGLQEVGSGWVLGDGGDQARGIADAAALPYAVFCPALSALPRPPERPGKGPYGAWDLVPATGHEERQFGVAALSRFPMVTWKRVALPRERDEQRVCLVATAALPDGAASFLVTHLSIDEAERVEQAAQVAHLASLLGPRVIVAADLNDVPGSPGLASLEAVVKNTASAGGGTPLPTFPARAPTRRLDHVLTGPGFEPLSARVLPDIVSDHLAVATEIASSRRGLNAKDRESSRSADSRSRSLRSRGTRRSG